MLETHPQAGRWLGSLLTARAGHDSLNKSIVNAFTWLDAKIGEVNVVKMFYRIRIWSARCKMLLNAFKD